MAIGNLRLVHCVKDFISKSIAKCFVNAIFNNETMHACKNIAFMSVLGHWIILMTPTVFNLRSLNGKQSPEIITYTRMFYKWCLLSSIYFSF